MKLEDLKDDAERIDFLRHIIQHVTGCETCLKNGDYEGHPETCTRTEKPPYNGELCPDMDFNDCRPR